MCRENLLLLSLLLLFKCLDVWVKQSLSLSQKLLYLIKIDQTAINTLFFTYIQLNQFLKFICKFIDIDRITPQFYYDNINEAKLKLHEYYDICDGLIVCGKNNTDFYTKLKPKYTVELLCVKYKTILNGPKYLRGNVPNKSLNLFIDRDNNYYDSSDLKTNCNLFCGDIVECILSKDNINKIETLIKVRSDRFIPNTRNDVFLNWKSNNEVIYTF